VAEAPYVVSDNVVSRKSHYYHEGKKSEYDQARDLWSRVMTEQQRKNTIKNTGNMLKFVGYSDIQVSEDIVLPESRGIKADNYTEEIPRSGVQHRTRLCTGHLQHVAEA
jgi:hypothetical protein